MVQCGFAFPVDFLMIFSKAVLRVHRSGHHILSPHSCHPLVSEVTDCQSNIKVSENIMQREPLPTLLPCALPCI